MLLEATHGMATSSCAQICPIIHVCTHALYCDMHSKEVSKNTLTSERTILSIAMTCPHCAYSIDIRILEFRYSWWYVGRANTAIGSERNIISEKYDCSKSYVSILRVLGARGGRKLIYND